MVGTIPPCSILWIAAADTSERSPSCCSDRPIRLRRLNTLRPMEPAMRCSSPGCTWLGDCASRQGASSLKQNVQLIGQVAGEGVAVRDELAARGQPEMQPAKVSHDGDVEALAIGDHRY